jgi:hypothetical protein
MEGADGNGILALRGLGQEAGIHGLDLVGFAGESGFQVFQRAFHRDGMNLAMGLAAQLLEDAGVVGGVNLLGAGGGAKETGGPMQTVLVGFDGKGGVLGVGVRLALKSSQKILNGNGVFRDDCRHGRSSLLRSKPTGAERAAL